MFEIRDYVQDVLARVSADEGTKARLAEDLTAHLAEMAEQSGVRAALRQAGTPDAMAAALMDTLYDSKEDVIAQLLRAQRQGIFEYKSRRTLLGLPLVHIKMNRANGRGGICVARGIIAIGDVAIGGIAIGGVSLGVLAIGGLAAGLLSLGGLALGLVGAIGGLAIGGIAFGGCAIGLYAMGGAAVASRVASGAAVHAPVAISNASDTPHALHTLAEARDAVLAAYPNTPRWLLSLLTWVVR